MTETLGQRLTYLFENIHPESGPYTNAYVAEQINANPDKFGGVRVTEQYLSMLRRERRTNPHQDLVRALAAFFGVSAGYLRGDDSEADHLRTTEQVAFMAAMRDQNVRTIALRSAGLPPEVQASLTGIIDQFRAQLGLPEDPTSADEAQSE
ncbi:XRE family transcriptional regulator [Streptacidiphilus fuscans]|uniref:XRE family transcriptional regulator n=1 Tax=Streptacidiphilus fuscans TaxID=2789292 RepID=A0A931FJB9_9ACTN|nr:XRE family transcriptional regulator [Streptacidiphilus fuscans]MBF9072604.1 XRE family transcriptional regulator [Streptacidiphilus fuscans]